MIYPVDDSVATSLIKINQDLKNLLMAQKTMTLSENGLFEDLDQAITFEENQKAKASFLMYLQKISSTCALLPESYNLTASIMIGDSFAEERFAGIREGTLGGEKVRVRVFRTTSSYAMGQVKRLFYHEIPVWKHTKNKNLVPFLGVYEPIGVLEFCIVSSWQSGGNIRDYLNSHPNAERLYLLGQAVCGLQHLHRLDIVHGGVHPGNILIDGNYARLGDFGIAAVMTRLESVGLSYLVGSTYDVVRYMAPELHRQPSSRPSDRAPTKESDIFSFAITAYEVLTGTLPYGDDNDDAIANSIVRGDRPSLPEGKLLSDQMKAMIQTCWSAKREQRLGVEAVLDVILPELDVTDEGEWEEVYDDQEVAHS